MRRIMIRVAYDGTAYHGWQLQDGQVSIESVLNEAISHLLKEEISVIGASRTDSGVHSLGTAAVFDTNTRIPAEKLKYAINQGLPEDIRVIESREVRPDFHPRKCVSHKTYEYVICNAPVYQPVGRLYRYFYHYPLDEKKMAEAASYVVGEHDFTSFCSIGTQAKDFVRTMEFCEVTRTGDDIRIRIRGNGFLYNMVRILAGTLIEIGGGKREPSEMKQILEARDRNAAGPTAPAQGLTMLGIDFEEDPGIAEKP
ncbi:MAG: tRNA pseudouridine(38-40) synthase TruA [Lachnospiraceae bacterium]|nr:tRNA pseudouridine(38-40) synthase TruA [Lachnospiraceae bacterium]